MASGTSLCAGGSGGTRGRLLLLSMAGEAG